MISISIIVPVYNVAEYLPKCIESIKSQTMTDFEVICIDDGSTDNSLEILRGVAKEDKRFVVLTQENKGPGIARNVGISMAKGDYILFMDPDDWYPDENVLELHLSKASMTDCTISGGSLSFYDSQSEKIVPGKISETVFKDEKVVSFTSYQYDYFFMRFMYSTKMIRDNNVIFPDLRRYQDVLFFLKAMSVAREFYCFKEETYVYRGNNRPPAFFTKDKSMAWLEGMKQAIALSRKKRWHRIHYKTVLRLTYDNFLQATIDLRLSADPEYESLMESVISEIDWRSLQYIDFGMDSLYPLYKVLYGQYLWDILNVPSDLKKDCVNRFIKKYGPETFVKSLTYNYLNDKDSLVRITSAMEKNKINRRVSTIGIFNEALNVGGVERCISLLIPMFDAMGYNVILFTESSPKDDKFHIKSYVKRIVIPGRDQTDRVSWVRRVYKLSKSIIDNKVDVMYYHSYWKGNLIFDALTCKYICSIPFILHHHNVFSSMLARNNDLFSNALELFSFSDCIIALSTVDELYFRLHGIPSEYISNPTSYLSKVIRPKDDNMVIWVGRFVPNHKQPMEALKIINLVSKTHPDVKLYMIGDGGQDVKDEMTRFIDSNRLNENIFFTGFIDNVQDYYASARLMLMTSCIEGFPMAVAECKYNGLPLVTYDLPYVEMIRDGAGVVRVDQLDHVSAASAVCDLLDNECRLNILSDEALKSLADYSDESIKEEWIKVFEFIQYGESSDLLKLEPSDDDLKILVDTLTYHAKLSKSDKNSVKSSRTVPGVLESVKEYIEKGIQGLRRLLRYEKVRSISKADEMLAYNWKTIYELEPFNTDFIISAGTGSRIMHNLSINKKRGRYYLPLDSFGEYSLATLQGMFVRGCDELFSEYEIQGEQGNFLKVRDTLFGITSTKEFRKDEDFEERRDAIREHEIHKLEKISEVLSDGCDCTIVMCNRHDLNEIVKFGESLKNMFPTSNMKIIAIQNYPELDETIMYKTVRDTDSLKIINVAMNDNSPENKWAGNERNWSKLLTRIKLP